MKIALIGYGKMGHAIEEIAISRGHEIVAKINRNNTDNLDNLENSGADVAIEFTSPVSAEQNIRKCLTANIPVVSGTTGWVKELKTIEELCIKVNGAFLYASNFSVGVNIFFKLNTLLATWMNGHLEYDVTINEVHHTQKKDAPSGTAISLAEQVICKLDRKSRWVNDTPSDPSALLITSERIDPAPGTHTVKYTSAIDDIVITHEAHSRKGFAQGAILAAEFLKNKKGIFTMADVLSL